MRTVCYLLYKYIAIHLPLSNARLSFGSKYVRRFLVKNFLKQMGENVNIEKGAIFTTELKIGSNSNVGINCILAGEVIIGNDVVMGPEVYIYTVNHRFEKSDVPIRMQGYTIQKPVIIGNDVWIGSRVTILPGVNIGDGCVIGASAVVTKNAEPFTVLAGNPAKMISLRR